MDRSRCQQIAAAARADRADLVCLVLELADLVDVDAPDLDPGVVYRNHPLVRALIYRDLPGGSGLVDLADELTPDALEVLAEVLAAAQDPDRQPVVISVRPSAWELRGVDVVLSPEVAEWWGSSLAILIGAVLDPDRLANELPDTDPHEVAREVLDEVSALLDAKAAAEAVIDQLDDPDDVVDRINVVRSQGEGAERVVLITGDEIGMLAYNAEVYARAVLDPAGPEAEIAHGAIGYAAAAWADELGRAAGTLP